MGEQTSGSKTRTTGGHGASENISLVFKSSSAALKEIRKRRRRCVRGRERHGNDRTSHPLSRYWVMGTMSLPDGGNSRVYHCKVHESGGERNAAIGESWRLAQGRIHEQQGMGRALFGLMTIGA